MGAQGPISRSSLLTEFFGRNCNYLIMAAMKAMKVMKAMKAAKPMKVAAPMKAMKKAMKVSKVAKGKRSKSSVFRGTKERTSGGLKKSDLVKSKTGKVVSKKASEASKKKF